MIEIHDEEFREWVSSAKSRFMDMVQTMIDVAHVVELHTAPLVPLETGRLEHSFKFVVTERTPDFIEVEIGYDASDPESGFVYAEYQHEEDLHHPLRGEQFYLKNGIELSRNESFELIEVDYLSLFGGIH